MTNYPDSCYLYYSKYLSSEFVGNFFYSLQIILLGFGLINSFVASPSKNNYRGTLFNKISQRFYLIYCRSTKFGRELRGLGDQTIVLDIPNIKGVGKMTKEDIYELMWSLVFCKYVGEKTKTALRTFLPLDFPTK